MLRKNANLKKLHLERRAGKKKTKPKNLHPSARFVPHYVITFASEKGWEIPPLSSILKYMLGAVTVLNHSTSDASNAVSLLLSLCQKCLGECLPKGGLCVQHHQLQISKQEFDGKHLLMQVQRLFWVKRHYSYWPSVIISATQLTPGSVPCPPFKHQILTRKHISTKCWGKCLTTAMI